MHEWALDFSFEFFRLIFAKITIFLLSTCNSHHLIMDLLKFMKLVIMSQSGNNL